MNAQTQNQTNTNLRPTVSPEFIAGVLGDLDMIEGAYCPVSMPTVMPAARPQIETEVKATLANGWLAAMILVVGLGSLAVQSHLVKPVQVAPPAAVKQIVATPANPVARVAPAHVSIPQKREVKLSDVNLKLARIMKRADSINQQARLVSAQ